MLALRDFWPELRYAVRRRSSAENAPPARVEILDVQRLLSDPRFIAKCVDIAYPAATQHQQCQTVARDLGRDPETVRRWLHGATRPSFNDFWPVILRVVHARADDRTYTSLLDVMRAI